MASAPPDAEGIRFGRFLLAPGVRSLTKSGREVRIQAQPLSLLCILAQRPGELVSRAELHDLLWPGVQYLDFETALNSTVKKLRQALDDDAAAPRFIRTVPRRGYMFVGASIGPAKELAEADGPEASVSASEVSPSEVTPAGAESAELPRGAARSRPRWVAFAIAGILAAAIVAAAVWAGERFLANRDRLPPLNGVRYTSHSGEDSIIDAAISPDGRYLAYVDQHHVRVAPVGEPSAEAILNLDLLHITRVSWFPDSTSLLVDGLESPGETHALWRVSILGNQQPLELFTGAVDGRVSPDGMRYALIMEGRNEIRVAAADHSENRTLVRAAQIGQTFWAPDGGRLYFTVQENWQYRLRSVPARSAVSEFQDAGITISGDSVVLLPGGRLLYSVSAPVGSDLFEARLDPATGMQLGQPRRVQHVEPLQFMELSATADGSQVAYLQGEQEAGIWTGDLSGSNTRLENLSRLTLTDADAYPHSWTADSHAVLFETRSGKTWNIFRQIPGAAEAQPLLYNAPGAIRPVATADGKWLLYETPGRNPSIMRVATGGGASTLLYSFRASGNFRCPLLAGQPCVVQEAYENDEHGSKIEFVLLEPETHRILTGRNYHSAKQLEDWDLSPDGKTIAILERGEADDDLLLLDLAGGTRRLSPANGGSLKSVNWWPNGQGFFCASLRRDALRMLSIGNDGKSAVLAEDLGTLPSWAVASPDGRKLAWVAHRRHYNAWIARFR
jgi:DNA-binding winged helix-turn-helix (wHTH) protein/Tol biopolymer transport system component